MITEPLENVRERVEALRQNAANAAISARTISSNYYEQGMRDAFRIVLDYIDQQHSNEEEG